MSETDSIESLKKEVIDLNSEIDRLNVELAKTSSEKILSAQYGLLLLDEKYELQRRYDELESSYETTKKDSDNLREAFNISKITHRMSATKSIEQEERLLQESANKEANFATTLHELERELKQIRHELERVQAEKERYLQEKTELIKQKAFIEWERKTVRSELKELKFRESKLLRDNNVLEKENISLQKQNCSLKLSLIDSETSMNEVKRLAEEVEALEAQNEKVEHLKRIAERQTVEALEALQSEREQKYVIKKELDQRINSEAILKLSSFAAFAGLKFGNYKTNDRTKAFAKNHPTLQKLETYLLQTILQN